ncbi:MAG: hypothetical protein OS112_04285 [Methanoregula sp.]|nr:MAG: hypothetical protein OS112_04285 [Methanoregula sp.]
MPFIKPKESGSNLFRWLELSVPALSFGGAFIAVIFWITDFPADFRISILGCVFASWVLAYLAWMREKKDIVALTTPIYSFIFLAVPTDNFSAVILELLYAASLTILLVRLKYRFGRSGAAESDRKKLAEPLRTYVEQTRDSFMGTSPETAHHATVAFVRFAEGEFKESSQRSVVAAGQPGDTGPVSSLTRAFMIVSEHAILLDQSLPRPATYLTFLPEDSGVLANPLLPAQDDDAGFYTTLDNALLLLFSAAWNASVADDRPHLLSCQAFARKLMSGK